MKTLRMTSAVTRSDVRKGAILALMMTESYSPKWFIQQWLTLYTKLMLLVWRPTTFQFEL